MYHIIYQSIESINLSEEDLRIMLEQARTKNRQCGITGLLLYSEGQFLQVIEGEEATVRSLYEVIEQDSRHAYVQKLADGPIPRRYFASWAMGFAATGPVALTQVAGYLNTQTSGELLTRTMGCDDELASLLHSFAKDAREQVY